MKTSHLWGVVAAWALAGCATTTTTTEHPNTTVLTHPTQVIPADPRADLWAYQGAYGTLMWSDLSPAYAACKTGKAQSPVDLVGATVQPAPLLTPSYVGVPLRVVNNGHNIVINLAGGGSLTLEGKEYKLTQAHFHHPSEHTIDGAKYAMELHLVHTAADGSLAVIGVFVQPGAENLALRPLFNALPETNGSALNGEGLLDPADLLPTDRRHFRYEGSLTSPPCTEGVHWLVLRAPIELSQPQIDAFAKLFPLNARPLQKLGDRVVHVDSLP